MLSSAPTFTRSFRHSIEFSINGKNYLLKEGEFDPTQNLTSFLRSPKAELKGVKLGCGEGGCGACTVVVSSKDPLTGKIKHRPVNSCLMPVGQAHHTAITTIEYLGTVRDGIHPIQHSLVEHHATQCGFCTPGIAMNAYAMFLENPNPTAAEIDEQFDGNLCRCTGYRSVIDALRKFSSDKKPCDDDIVSEVDTKIRPNAEPIVPEYVSAKFDEPVEITSGNHQFYIPSSLEQLIELRRKHPNSKIMIGCSEIGIDLKNRGADDIVYISSQKIDELYDIKLKEGFLEFGANTPLQDIMMFCEHYKGNDDEKKLLRALRDRLRYFSSTQIRNTASVIGNLAAAGAVTDMSNFMLGSNGSYLAIDPATGKVTEKSCEGFFVGYKKTKLTPGEVVTKFRVPLLKQDDHLFCYKQAHRRDDDICIVSATVKATIDDKTNIVKSASVAFSGMAAFPQRAPSVEKALVGKPFTLDTIREAGKAISVDLPIADDAPGGYQEFRRIVSPSFLVRFFHQTERERGRPHDASAADVIPKPEGKFTVGGCKKPAKGSKGHVGEPVHHRAAIQQCTGEALYVDDMLMPYNGLCGGYIGSPVAAGKIKKVDYSKVLKAPGVVDVITAADIRGVNLVGDVRKDESVFADKEVCFIGQPIAMVVADTDEHAWNAARLAEIEIEETRPVVSIPQAIKENSFFDISHEIQRGDPIKGFEKCEHVLEGEVTTAGQSHFYLETQSALAEYLEDDRLRVTGSSQNPTFCQTEIARVCGIPYNKVDFHTKRMGGGFGGKETRASPVANTAAVAAYKLKRPVKIVLPRNYDMSTAGIRHPSYSKFKVGYNSDGVIKSAKFDHYFDCGYSVDVSIAVTDRALLHSDSAYYVEDFKTKSHLCKTNTLTSTAYRGFGGPQGMIAMEAAIDKVALSLNLDPAVVRFRNLYKEGERTHFDVPLVNCNTKKCWSALDKQFKLSERQSEVKRFNAVNRYKKRGVAVTPLKFGIAFTFSTLNQGNSLVHCYRDGTVLVSHGGTEMGQGLNTKMCQVAATILDIPVSSVRIEETATDKCANTSPTAASSGSDLNGHAVEIACQKLKERLAKYRPGRTFTEAVNAAYLDKIDMSARGYYGMKEVGFDWSKGRGTPFQYYTYGASGSVVEIDCLTGDHVVLRSDLVYDTGSTLNSGIDVGQLEGAFIQGMGWLTIEEFVKGNFEGNRWLKPGKIFTDGPSYYKIPGINDIPVEFNVGFLEGSENKVGVFRSKAIGEPPFLLANSVGFAIVDAIRNARKENGIDEKFKLDFPMSAPRIRTLVGTRN